MVKWGLNIISNPSQCPEGIVLKIKDKVQGLYRLSQDNANDNIIVIIIVSTKPLRNSKHVSTLYFEVASHFLTLGRFYKYKLKAKSNFTLFMYLPFWVLVSNI